MHFAWALSQCFYLKHQLSIWIKWPYWVGLALEWWLSSIKACKCCFYFITLCCSWATRWTIMLSCCSLQWSINSGILTPRNYEVHGGSLILVNIWWFGLLFVNHHSFNEDLMTKRNHLCPIEMSIFQVDV